jgi:L-threonylcarbamoyladenylate synthase
VKIDGTTPNAIALAAARLVAGDLVAFPTETVYGLGARADDDAAVAKIYATKGRPVDHPLIVHVADARAAAAFVSDLPPTALALMAACWPGPVTLVLPRRDGVAHAAAGGHATIALRCPAHPMAQALLQQAQALGVSGVAAPSANRFGRVSPTQAAHVVEEFGDAVWVLDGGACDVGIESAIVDVSRGQPVLLRPGALTAQALSVAAGITMATPAQAATSGAEEPRVSGSLASHYAPRARVRLMPSKLLQEAVAVMAAGGPLVAAATDAPKLAVYSRAAMTVPRGMVHRRMPSEARAAAQELFAVLRELDATGTPLIWVEQPPDDAAWDGVRDRLQRAAHVGP